MVRVRAEAEVTSFPSACIYGTTRNGKVKSGSTKKRTRTPGHWQKRSDGYSPVTGTPQHGRQMGLQAGRRPGPLRGHPPAGRVGAEGKRQVNVRKRTPKARAFIAKYRDNPRAIAKYLNGALATGDPVLITNTIGAMVRAQGATRVARETGRRRENFYRMFAGGVSPTFHTAIAVLAALRIQLIAKPSESKRSTKPTKKKPSPKGEFRTGRRGLISNLSD
jgi:probable addiction module antidote protein